MSGFNDATNFNQYLIVVRPHEELRNKINYIKNDFAETYRSANATFGQPQIALVTFTQPEINEERIINRLQSIAKGYHPFKIELKDFGSFPSHSIFIKVETRLQVKNLVEALKDARPLITSNKDNKPHFIDDPYILIARKLVPWQYEKAWLQYSNLQFTGKFIANNFILFKRKTGEKNYRTVQQFHFLNMPETIQQGDLFS